MFYDPVEEKIIDYVGGLEDLKNKQLKFIGNPEDRIKEDNLRLLRAIRFKNRFDFEMPERDWQVIKDNMRLIYYTDNILSLFRNVNYGGNVARKPIQEELNKILMHKSRAEAMEDLLESGFFLRIIPEMQNLKGTRQPKEFHEEGDAWNHTIKSLKNIPEDAPIEVVWAVLLHDIGKPITMKIPEKHGVDRIRFNAHEKESALVTEANLKELKFSNEKADKIKWLVANHMIYQNFPKMGKDKKRTLMQHPYFPDLLKVVKADIYGSEPLDTEAYDYMIEEWEEEQSRVEIKPLLNGNEVMAMFNLDPKKNKADGKKVGEILAEIHKAQLLETVGTKEEAVAFAQSVFSK